jgi:transcriptional regulator with XRE-family HTH domain
MRKRVYYSSGDLNPFLGKINNYLTEQGLSPTSLSVKAGLGSSTISNLLKRNNMPTLFTLFRICSVFGIRAGNFLNEIQDSYPELFVFDNPGVERYDPLSRRKDQIYDDVSALPAKDRDETIRRLNEEYGKK